MLTGLHTIMLPIVFTFFFGRSVKNVIRKLKARGGLLVVRTGLGGRLVYYQLSQSACSLLGFPENRAQPQGPGAIARNLAVLWQCAFSEGRRELWEAKKVSEILRTNVTGSHIAELGNINRIFAIYVPDGTSRAANVMRQLRHRIKAARAIPDLEPWIERRVYSFLVLVETEKRKEALTDLAKEAFPDVYVRVATSVGPRTIAEAIRKKNNHEEA